MSIEPKAVELTADVVTIFVKLLAQERNPTSLSVLYPDLQEDVIKKRKVELLTDGKLELW